MAFYVVLTVLILLGGIAVELHQIHQALEEVVKHLAAMRAGPDDDPLA